MAVDKALLESCIAEAAGDDKEMSDFLRERYTKNDTLAAKFVGGYTRTADYTQKTQKLAEREKEFTSQGTQLTQLRAQLEGAEAEKTRIMKDLAAHRITVAKARAMTQTLKDTYNLTDEDVPGMSDLIETAKTQKVVDSTDDLDARFAKFGEDITARMEKKFAETLLPELGGMASLPIVWNRIAREHRELTGKDLTEAEQHAILKAARAGEDGLTSLVGQWERKFQIAPGEWGDGLRMQKRDENLKADWAKEREASEAADRSKRALEVVTGPKNQELGDGPGISSAFKTRFKTYDPDPNKPAVADNGGVPSLAVAPGQHVRQTGDRGPSGAQRAAQKFLEQRSGQKVA